MKIKILGAVFTAIILSGCVGMQDSEGWDSSQKSEFLTILKTDKYMSICNQQALYAQAKTNENSKLMSKLLLAYTHNLANGCLVNTSKSFGAYKQKITAIDIKRKLKAGQTIEQILKPYVPDYRQFDALIKQYHARKNSDTTSAKLLKNIRLNIERVKMMKPNLGDTYVLVNIPEYQIRLIENDKTSVKMKVVIGTIKNKTPIFSENLKYITLNPAWNVPDSIARNEIIPKTLRNPGYLKSHRLVIRKDYNLNSPALRFSAVNAKAYKGGKGHVPFKFIEVPSNRNALGRVKFIFPNHHSVYMHDTPAKHLFKRTKRSYSHGCIRLEKPKYMLEYISKNYTAHDYTDVTAKYKSRKTHYLKIVKPLPVHTAYLTTYVNQSGKLLVFEDIYNYNRVQKLNF
ncbi:MAG: L,D-transpeptidase family protein [Sulfurovum sp.]|nr:L,D-transpeptidase family protein [Sulfurovum sp.]